MKNSVVMSFGAIVALLLIGLLFTATGGDLFPYTRQTYDDAGSTGTLTSEKAPLLALLILGVPGLIVGMAVGLYVVVWLLNRQVTHAQQLPAEPFPLLTGQTDAQAAASSLVDNAPYIVAGVGALMVVVTIIVLLVA